MGDHCQHRRAAKPATPPAANCSTQSSDQSAPNPAETMTTDYYLPCETRFRTSDYFLDDQLKCSDALADLKHMKHWMDTVSHHASALNPWRKTTPGALNPNPMTDKS